MVMLRVLCRFVPNYWSSILLDIGALIFSSSRRRIGWERCNSEEERYGKVVRSFDRLKPENFPAQRTSNACEECLAEGTVWVALRECQACGHVGCCDSSTGKHATKHFIETKHPVMRAVAPAAWVWCYVHKAQGYAQLKQVSAGNW